MDTTETRAVLTFARERRGIASWLATPAPMGALDFVSADAHLAAAFVIKDPVLMVEDILGFMEGVAPETLQELAAFQAEKDVDHSAFCRTDWRGTRFRSGWSYPPHSKLEDSA